LAMPPSSRDLESQRAFAAEIYHRLLEVYGEPRWRAHYAPIDELVLTFLSQSTSDLNSGRAFAEIASVIQPGGLAQQKAPRIQAALRRIMEERGELNIDFLADMPTPDALQWLTSFDGIGHKTASIVLLFCFGKETFPVDTHVGRVSRRLGIAEPKDSEEKIKGIWESLTPPEWYYPLHLNLIRHGREVCHSRRPACWECPLEDLCLYEDKTNAPIG
jgi:endonuclease-3